jgi:hypothetical protein
VIIRVALFWLAYLAILFAIGILKPLAPFWGALSAVCIYLLSRAMKWRTRNPACPLAICVVAGVAIGCALYVVQLLVVAGFSVTTGGGVTLRSAAIAIATFVSLSFMEELGFRGYALREIEARYGAWVALIATARTRNAGRAARRGKHCELGFRRARHAEPLEGCCSTDRQDRRSVPQSRFNADCGSIDGFLLEASP